MTRHDPGWAFIVEAADEAAALLEQMEPTNNAETQALQRTTAGLKSLQAYIERERQRSYRGPVAVIPLVVGLDRHPAPDKARYDLLIHPLIAETGSITSARQARAWLAQWLTDANNAIYAVIVPPWKDRGGQPQ